MPARTTSKPGLKVTAKPRSAAPATEISKARALIASVVGHLQVSNMQEFRALTHEEILLSLDSDDEDEFSITGRSEIEAPASEESINELREMALGIAPTNTIEAMLALQITELHRLAVIQALRLKFSQPVESAVQCAKILDTLIRAFASHAETLRKLRS
jgi:hypothetical protein